MAWRLLLAAFFLAGCSPKAEKPMAQTPAPAPAQTNEAAARPDQEWIKGFRVPDYDDQGIMLSQVFGEMAKVMLNGNIEIQGLKMEFYKYEGEERKVEMTVTSPLCVFNRTKGTAVSDSEVQISRDGFVVTGKGFTFNNEKKRLRILSEAKVVMVGAQKTLKSLEKDRE